MFNTDEFIKRYGKYYFTEYKDGSNNSENLYKDLGIKTINRTEPGVESFITEKLEKGIHDRFTIAWKVGSLRPEHLKMGKKSVPVKNRYNDFSNSIDEYIENAHRSVKMEPSDWTDWEKIGSAFKELRKVDITGFGSVYIINSLYFLSKGVIPIYDKYAHIAIKALLLNKNPDDLYVAPMPLKVDDTGDQPKAIMVLSEYVSMIEKVFGIKFGDKNKMFIKRDLDQALWVYGHRKEKCDSKSEK